MAAAVALRTDFTGSALRHLARYTRDANQARRLLALAVIYDGALVAKRPRRGCRSADSPGLGAAVQRRGAGGAD